MRDIADQVEDLVYSRFKRTLLILALISPVLLGAAFYLVKNLIADRVRSELVSQQENIKQAIDFSMSAAQSHFDRRLQAAESQVDSSLRTTEQQRAALVESVALAKSAADTASNSIFDYQRQFEQRSASLQGQIDLLLTEAQRDLVGDDQKSVKGLETAITLTHFDDRFVAAKAARQVGFYSLADPPKAAARLAEMCKDLPQYAPGNYAEWGASVFDGMRLLPRSVAEPLVPTVAAAASSAPVQAMTFLQQMGDTGALAIGSLTIKEWTHCEALRALIRMGPSAKVAQHELAKTCRSRDPLQSDVKLMIAALEAIDTDADVAIPALQEMRTRLEAYGLSYAEDVRAAIATWEGKTGG